MGCGTKSVFQKEPMAKIPGLISPDFTQKQEYFAMPVSIGEYMKMTKEEKEEI